jgi:hypothetical protein
MWRLRLQHNVQARPYQSSKLPLIQASCSVRAAEPQRPQQRQHVLQRQRQAGADPHIP